MRRVEAAHRFAILGSRVSCQGKFERIESIFARPARQELARISQRPRDFRESRNDRIGRNRVRQLADTEQRRARQTDWTPAGAQHCVSTVWTGRLRRNGLRLYGLRKSGLRLHGSGNFVAASRAHRAFVIGRGNSRHVGLTFLAPHPCGSIGNRTPTGEKGTQPARQGIIVTVQIDARPVLPLFKAVSAWAEFAANIRPRINANETKYEGSMGTQCGRHPSNEFASTCG